MKDLTNIHGQQTTETKVSQLPQGFSLCSRNGYPGLYYSAPDEKGKLVEIRIGPPLYVLGATRDENGKAWGLYLAWNDQDGRPHRWAMPQAMLTGNIGVWLGHLADEGWSVAPGGKARQLLALYLHLSISNPTHHILCVPRTGWHKNVFVLPDEVIGIGEGEKIVLQIQTSYNPFLVAGTLEKWQNTIGRWSRDNSRLMLALCASLAAPLLEASSQESGGFNLTGQSSTGKTTALIVAGSVWGKGSSSGGYVQSWRATTNGLEGLAALHSDTALCLDEIGQAPGRTIMEASYMLANGMGKTRSTVDSSAKMAQSWRCMVLSSGEKGLAEKIAEEWGMVQAGQLVRLIDVSADAEKGMGLFEDLHGHGYPQAFADALKQAAATDHGHAARAFIKAFVVNRVAATESLQRRLVAEFSSLCPARVDGQVQRVARRFLLCGLAGDMAAEWGLLPWEQGEALRAMKNCFEAWLDMRGSTGVAEDTAIVEKVMLFIEQHGTSRFQNIGDPDALCINRAGFRKREGNSISYYIFSESFKEICKGYPEKKAAQVLKDAGLLKTNRGDGRGLKSQLPTMRGIGRPMVYMLCLTDNEGNEPE